LAVTALALGGKAGGEVARALDRVAATLRERRELRAEVRALATQARASAGVLIVAPLAFAALVSTIEPAVAGFLLASPLGLACLAVGLALDGLGALWMAHIVDAAA
jgi:tight adherence protein B